MKRYQPLYEIRAHADKNPRVSAYQQLLPYRDREDIFISFTKIDKIGINPKSHYNTPLGIYCYPVKEAWKFYGFDKDYNDGKSVGKSVPWAGYAPFIFVLQLKDKSHFIDNLYTDYGSNDYDRDMDKLRRHYEKDIDTETMETKIRLGTEIASTRNAVPSMWNVTREISLYMAGHRQPESAHVWNSVLRQVLGYSGMADRSGRGIIHSAEPCQALFLSVKAFTVVDKILNKDYGGVGKTTVAPVEMLKKYKYDVGISKGDLFVSACIDNIREIIDYMLGQGVSPDIMDAHGNTALIACAEQNDGTDMVRYLIDKGASVNMVNKNLESALYTACSGLAPVATVQYLLDNGADVNSTNENEETALSQTVRQFTINYNIKYEQALDLLLKHHPDLDKHYPNFNDGTVLHFTTIKIFYVGAEKFLRAGANVEEMTNIGTPLYCAVARVIDKRDVEDWLTLIRLLLNHGANPNTPDLKSSKHPTPVDALMSRIHDRLDPDVLIQALELLFTAGGRITMLGRDMLENDRARYMIKVYDYFVQVLAKQDGVKAESFNWELI